MTKKQTNTEDVQDVSRETEVAEQTRQPSTLYTIRSFGQAVAKIRKMGLLDPQNLQNLDRMYALMVNGYLLNTPKENGK